MLLLYLDLLPPAFMGTVHHAWDMPASLPDHALPTQPSLPEFTGLSSSDHSWGKHNWQTLLIRRNS